MVSLKTIHHDLGLETETAYVVPLSDLHIGAEFDIKKFKGYRDWILNKDNAYTVLCGDIIDNSIKDSIGDTYGTMRPRDQKKIAIELLKPLAEAGKILAWLDGNHEARTSKNTDEYIGETITQALGISDLYDPDGAYLFLSVGWDRKHNKRSRNTYTVFMLHGSAGGKRVGSKANALEDMARSVQADLYLSAHCHQKINFPSYAVIPETRTKTLRFSKRHHVMAGSFQEWQGYPVRKGYNPTPAGSPRIRLDGRCKDMRCSI